MLRRTTMKWISSSIFLTKKDLIIDEIQFSLTSIGKMKTCLIEEIEINIFLFIPLYNPRTFVHLFLNLKPQHSL